MGIRLGNLKVLEVEKKHDFSLTDSEREALEHIRQDDAQTIESDKFHVFDLPITTFVCGSEATRTKVLEILKKYNADIKGQISVGFQEEN